MLRIITQRFRMFERAPGEKELFWLQKADWGDAEGAAVGVVSLAPPNAVSSLQNSAACPAVQGGGRQKRVGSCQRKALQCVLGFMPTSYASVQSSRIAQLTLRRSEGTHAQTCSSSYPE